jgi:hypothetical protein
VVVPFAPVAKMATVPYVLRTPETSMIGRMVFRHRRCTGIGVSSARHSPSHGSMKNRHCTHRARIGNGKSACIQRSNWFVRQLSISRKPLIDRVGESAHFCFRERVVANGELGKKMASTSRWPVTQPHQGLFASSHPKSRLKPAASAGALLHLAVERRQQDFVPAEESIPIAAA